MPIQLVKEEKLGEFSMHSFEFSLENAAKEAGSFMTNHVM